MDYCKKINVSPVYPAASNPCLDTSAEQSENDLLRTRFRKTLAKLKLRLNIGYLNEA